MYCLVRRHGVWRLSIMGRREAMSFRGRHARKAGAVLLCGGLVLPACLDEVELGQRTPSPCDFIEPGTEPQGVKVLTFWSGDTREAAAFSVLEDRAQDEDLRVSVTSDRDRDSLQMNLQEGNSELLPNVFQVNGGSDVLQYVDPDLKGSLCPLDRLVERYDVDSHYFEAALAPSRCRERLYAWPLSIHRLNTVLVNIEIYERAREQADKEEVELPDLFSLDSTDGLIDFLERFAELGLVSPDGRRVVPLSLGIQQLSAGASERAIGQEWVLMVLAFENVLASYGRFAYESLWAGSDALSSTEIRGVLLELSEDLESLGQFVPQLPRSWQQATEAVGEGEALLTVGGDWTRAQLDEADLSSHKVVTVPFPGTKDVFVYTPDSFAVPREVESDGSIEHRWFSSVLSDPATQVRFARQKQAIPAMSDLTPSQISSLGSDYLRDSYRQFAICHEDPDSCRLLLAVSGLGPAPNVDPCFDRLGRILAMIMGMEYAPPDSYDQECERPIPLTRAAATDELIELLVGVAEDGFVRECRTD